MVSHLRDGGPPPRRCQGTTTEVTERNPDDGPQVNAFPCPQLFSVVTQHASSHSEQLMTVAAALDTAAGTASKIHDGLPVAIVLHVIAHRDAPSRETRLTRVYLARLASGSSSPRTLVHHRRHRARRAHLGPSGPARHLYADSPAGAHGRAVVADFVVQNPVSDRQRLQYVGLLHR